LRQSPIMPIDKMESGETGIEMAIQSECMRGKKMTKNFIIAVVMAYSIGVTNVAISASPYNSHEKLEDQLPYIIIGIFSGISIFLLVNWFFKLRSNKASKATKKRR
jgi:hypothetical protein